MKTRKPNRLPLENLYQKENWYFITICSHNKQILFGNIKSNVGAIPQSPAKVSLNEIGKIIQEQWFQLQHQFENILLDEFIIMPNHIHGIIGFDGIPISKFTTKPTELSKIIKRFKQESSKCINNSNATGRIGFAPTTIWQKSYYDRIIRNETELHQFRKYIQENPLKWELDEYFRPN